MAGRGGGERTTVQNLEIVHVDSEDGVLYVRGGLPGPDGGLLELTASGN
jgi:large subunit ribosomal protein L3